MKIYSWIAMETAIGVVSLFLFSATLSTVAGATQVTFSDGTLSSAGWTYAQIRSAGAMATDTFDSLAGNPAPSRRITTTIPAASPAEIVFTFALFNDAIFDPATAPISSIDYFEHSRCTSGCNSLSQATGPALKQGSEFFVLQRLGAGLTGSSWLSTSAVGLVQNDFIRVVNAAYPFLDHDSHPDFSSSGAAIQFGYFRANSGPLAYSSDGGLDNWSLAVHPQSAVGVPTFGAGALCLLVALAMFLGVRLMRK